MSINTDKYCGMGKDLYKAHVHGLMSKALYDSSAKMWPNPRDQEYKHKQDCKVMMNLSMSRDIWYKDIHTQAESVYKKVLEAKENKQPSLVCENPLSAKDLFPVLAEVIKLRYGYEAQGINPFGSGYSYIFQQMEINV